MQSIQCASDNGDVFAKELSLRYDRDRQAVVTPRNS